MTTGKALLNLRPISGSKKHFALAGRLVASATLLLASGCNSTLLPFRMATNDPKIPPTAVSVDIPRYESGQLFAYYKFAKQREQQLKLARPELGYDSLLVRCWFSYPRGFRQYGELVELHFPAAGAPRAVYTRLQIFFNPSREYELLNNHLDSAIVAPRHGWPYLADSLRACRIKTLPTIEQIPTYQLLNSARGGLDYENQLLTVSVEVADRRHYRFYQYNNFERYKLIPEVNAAYSFVRLLRTELRLRPLDANWYGKP